MVCGSITICFLTLSGFYFHYYFVIGWIPDSVNDQNISQIQRLCIKAFWLVNFLFYADVIPPTNICSCQACLPYRCALLDNDEISSSFRSIKKTNYYAGLEKQAGGEQGKDNKIGLLWCYSHIESRLIEFEVDRSWGWIKLRLIEVQVDWVEAHWSWGSLKLRFIEVEVNRSWGWSTLRLM